MTDFPAPVQPPGRGEAGTADPPAALRSGLVDAIGRRRRRVRSRAAIACGVFATAAAVLLGGGVFTSGPERVLAIDDNGGEWVRVSILDGEAGAAEMTRELQDAGIDGQVELVPAVPQFVGHWMGLNQLDSRHRPDYCELYPVGETPRSVCANPPLVGGDDARFEGDTFQIRRDAIGELAETRTIFYVGREPEPGEQAQEFPPNSDATFRALGGDGEGLVRVKSIHARQVGAD